MSNVEVPKPAKESHEIPTTKALPVSRSTDRRYSEVVQEYLRKKQSRQGSASSYIIQPSEVLTQQADQSGPNGTSYVSWDPPDTPRSQRPQNPEGNQSDDPRATTTAPGTPEKDLGVPLLDVSRGSVTPTNRSSNEDSFTTAKSNLTRSRSPQNHGSKSAVGSQRSPGSPFTYYVTPSTINHFHGNLKSTPKEEEEEEQQQQQKTSTFHSPGSRVNGTPRNTSKHPAIKVISAGGSPRHLLRATDNEGNDESHSTPFPDQPFFTPAYFDHSVDGQSEPQRNQQRPSPLTNTTTGNEEHRVIEGESQSLEEAVGTLNYPPDETSATQYSINFSNSPFSATISSPLPWTPWSGGRNTSSRPTTPEDIRALEKTLRKQKRIAWCFVVSALILLVVTAATVLALEIPALKNKEPVDPLPHVSRVIMDTVSEMVMETTVGTKSSAASSSSSSTPASTGPSVSSSTPATTVSSLSFSSSPTPAAIEPSVSSSSTSAGIEPSVSSSSSTPAAIEPSVSSSSSTPPGIEPSVSSSSTSAWIEPSVSSSSTPARTTSVSSSPAISERKSPVPGGAMVELSTKSYDHSISHVSDKLNVVSDLKKLMESTKVLGPSSKPSGADSGVSHQPSSPQPPSGADSGVSHQPSSPQPPSGADSGVSHQPSSPQTPPGADSGVSHQPSPPSSPQPPSGADSGVSHQPSSPQPPSGADSGVSHQPSPSSSPQPPPGADSGVSHQPSSPQPPSGADSGVSHQPSSPQTPSGADSGVSHQPSPPSSPQPPSQEDEHLKMMPSRPDYLSRNKP